MIQALSYGTTLPGALHGCSSNRPAPTRLGLANSLPEMMFVPTPGGQQHRSAGYNPQVLALVVFTQSFMLLRSSGREAAHL